MRRLYVGGLPLNAVKADVVKLFRQFGARDENTVLPRDRRTRRKKGVAYIELESDGACDAAIATFDGFEIDGKALTVCRAEDRPVKALRKPPRR